MCNKGFGLKYNLKHHLKQVHKKDLDKMGNITEANKWIRYKRARGMMMLLEAQEQVHQQNADKRVCGYLLCLADSRYALPVMLTFNLVRLEADVFLQE